MRTVRVTLAYCLAVSAVACCLGPDRARGQSSEADAYFESRVRPILVERCGECHGVSGKGKGGLRLLSREGILKGGDSGPSAVPGKPDESALVQAVRYLDEPRMPPSGKLHNDEIAVLTRWVEAGLPWPESVRAAETAPAPKPLSNTPPIGDEARRFWSFQPVRVVPPPEVKDKAWPRSDIDRWVLAGLEAKNLRPAPSAERRAYIRRLAFDLLGLPPTPEQVEAFVSDPRPDAFDRLVDAFLASPRYGERWGRHWLDLVRYTDSFDARIAGTNNEMDINESWRYRDWVVNAFNRDLPYDRFVAEQIAGDLIATAAQGGFDADAVVATGLLAIGNWGGGDADKEKLLTDIADDQVDVVSRAFMGLTVGCARCHDHKFDPITTKDYYGLAGIFFSTHILPNVGPKTNGPPMLRIPLASPVELDRRARDEKRAKDLASRIDATLLKAKTSQARSLAAQAGRYIVGAWEYDARPSSEPDAPTIESFAASRGLVPFALRHWAEALSLRDDGRPLDHPVRNVLGRAGVLAWRGKSDDPSLLVNTLAESVSLLSCKLPARSVNVHPGPSTGVSVCWESPVAGSLSVSGELSDADPSGGDGVVWVVEHVRPGSTRTLAQGRFANGGRQSIHAGVTGGKDEQITVRKGDRVRLTVLPGNGHACDMTSVSLAIATADGREKWDLAGDLLADPLAGNPHADSAGRPGVWRFEESEGQSLPEPADPGETARWHALTSVLHSPGVDRAAVEAAARAFQKGWKRTDAGSPFWVRTAAEELALATPDREELARLRGELDRLRRDTPPPVPFTVGAQEGGVPGSPQAGVHDVRVHVRGSYARLGDSVPRHFPVVLAGETQPPITSGSGRLELARWLGRADHPLTARVMANRIWQHHFGAGIVRTSSNFGKLGERPTHPELLDHLARRFVDGGWSVKTLHREIVLSSTYRQSTEADPATFLADPENRLFGRTNRRRLDAESLRDGLLSVAGRLDTTAGGPAVRDANTPRRTLYLMTIRSDRSSFGALFDAADPTAMVDARTVSTVAPQALYLLNNDFVINQARALAQRLQGEAHDTEARIGRAYALLFGRPPTDAERAVGRESLARFTRPGGAGGVNPWAAYCHVLLCTNEWIYTD